MSPDERNMLTGFLNDLVGTRAPQRDPEAADMIARALSANPDAAYVLVQHTIVADQSLHAAQARIAELEDQLRPPQGSSGFLPQSSPWGQSQGQGYQGQGYQGQGYNQGGGWQPESTVPQGYQPMPAQQRPGVFSANSGLGSFLRNAGTTAAGVAGGEMLFSGIRDLFGGGGHSGGGEVINNYYDDDDTDTSGSSSDSLF